MSRFTLPRESYIPKQYEAKIEPKGLDVVIYFERNPAGKVSAKGFSGKRAKPDFYYNFGMNEQRRAQFVQEYVENKRERATRKAAFHAERKAFRHTLKVGDILYTSWGYDQTNVEFFQVIERSECTVKVREIKQRTVGTTGRDSWRTMPIPDSFCGETLTKRVQVGNRLRMASYSNASPWSGEPVYASTGH